MTKTMGRPKSEIKREVINTKIDKKLLTFIREKSKDTGIPINRLIENALRKEYKIE